MAQAAALAAADNRVERAIRARVKWLKNPSNLSEEEPRVWNFAEYYSDDEIYAILALSQKEVESGAFDYKHFSKKLDETTPVVARPRVTNKPLDLWRMLSQPEILENLWPNWNARSGKRGRDPGYFAKALLVCTATLGISAHLDDNYEKLTGEERHRDQMFPRPAAAAPTRIQVVFEWIERKAAKAAGLKAQQFGFKAYKNAMAQVKRIVDENENPGVLLPDHCIKTNIQLLKWLSVTYPQTCVRLGIDGMLIKAWVQQVGRQEPEKERKIRGKFAPNASPRFIGPRRGSLGRFVRGYYLYALVDLATNLPVVWGLWPAGETNNDARALRVLLNHLYEEWGDDCPVQQIVADRAWDVNEAVKDSALRFGVHLIVGRDDLTAAEEEEKALRAGAAVSVTADAAAGSPDDSSDAAAETDEATGKKPKRKVKRRVHNLLHRVDFPDIVSYDRFGNAYCRYCTDKNKNPLMLKRKTFDFLNPARRAKAGLNPGEAAREGSTFRVMFECSNEVCPGAKKRALPMHLNWLALSAYPHSNESNGRPDLHAERLALYARRNSCEALFGALKLGHKLGLDGSDRTHTPDERVVETLLSIALVLRSAFVVAHERIAQGGLSDVPMELLEAMRDAR